MLDAFKIAIKVKFSANQQCTPFYNPHCLATEIATLQKYSWRSQGGKHIARTPNHLTTNENSCFYDKHKSRSFLERHPTKTHVSMILSDLQNITK